MKYPVILADPGWRFRNYSEIGEGRNPIAHYDCMTREQLLAYPIDDYAAPGAILFLCVLDALQPLAFELLDAWGFTFKTVAFYWIKLNKSADPKGPWRERDFFTGLGYWTRGNPEQVWLATRGKHPPRASKAVRKLIISPRREHSRKPDQLYSSIRQLVKGRCLDLFARESHPGWAAVGDQMDLFDNGPVPTRRRASGKGAARL